MIRLNPIEIAKAALILAVVGWLLYVHHDRGNLQDKVKMQAETIGAYQAKEAAAVADAARKQSAYAEAKRKADNDAKDLLGRIAWLKKQNGKGCESAARVLKEYRGAK